MRRVGPVLFLIVAASQIGCKARQNRPRQKPELSAQANDNDRASMNLSAASSVAPQLADLWAGKASFQIDPNPVGFTGMHFLSLARDAMDVKSEDLSSTYYITNEMINGKMMIGTGLARSVDGLQFNNLGTVLRGGTAPAWDNIYSSFVSVWKKDGIFHLVYEGSGSNSIGEVGYATSTDGSNWTKHPTPILNHAQGKAWEKVNIGTPTVYWENGLWYVYYHGWDGHDLHVGVATGTSLTNLQRANNGDPILKCSDFGFDDGTIGRRSIIKEGDFYYMVYEASRDLNAATNNAFDTVAWTSSIARSKNLIGPWEKLPSGPILPPTSVGFGHDGPEWVRTTDGKLHVYYRDYVNNVNTTRRATLVASEPSACVTFKQQGQMSHKIGRAAGDGWAANVASDAANFLTFGPYAKNLPQGDMIAMFRLSTDNNTANNDLLATLDVYDSTAGKRVAFREVRRREFASINKYHAFPIYFTVPSDGHAYEFRTFWHDKAAMQIGDISVASLFLGSDTCVSQPTPPDNPPVIPPTPPDNPPVIPPTPPTPPAPPILPVIINGVNGLFHQLGRADGSSWLASVPKDSKGYMFYGPYTDKIPGGARKAVFRLQINSTAGLNQGVLVLDVYDATGGKVLATRVIKRRDFTKALTNQDFEVPFTNTADPHKLEFRGYWMDTADIRLIEVRVD